MCWAGIGGKDGLEIEGDFWDNAGLHAGVAQLVERNLAKVEVESSRLFSRSRILRKGKPGFPFC
jgi:hypothetical protein